MTEHFDYAVAGSTPFAALLAGALARDHGARVILVGRLMHALRPRRSIDMSVGPITRPETWQILQKTTPQTVDLLGKIGAGNSLVPADPLMLAESPDGAQALAHLKGVAQEYGAVIERQPAPEGFTDAYRFRDALTTDQRALTLALDPWLQDSGITILDPDAVTLSRPRSAPVGVAHNGQRHTADRLILADDTAIAAFGNAKMIAANLQARRAASLIFGPAVHLPAPLVHTVDTGLTVHRQPTGALDCTGYGPAPAVGSQACMHIGRDAVLDLAGHTGFTSYAAFDGGPVIGRARSGVAIHIAGLGPTALFQLPAIARFLAGTATGDETAYFTARAPRGKATAGPVAEFAPRTGAETAA